MPLIEGFAGKPQQIYADEERIPRGRLSSLLGVSVEAVRTALYNIRIYNPQTDIVERTPNPNNPHQDLVLIKVAGVEQILQELAQATVIRDRREPATDRYPWIKDALQTLEKTGECTIETPTRRARGEETTNTLTYRRP